MAAVRRTNKTGGTGKIKVLLVISYEPMWETMRKKNITTYNLIKDYNFSRGTLDSLKQGRNITPFTFRVDG